MIGAAQYGALADTIRCCQKYSIMMPWLSAPAVHLLQDTIRPVVTNLRDRIRLICRKLRTGKIQVKAVLI